MTAAARRIALCDADAMFVRCAQLADPAGAGQARLLLVGGSAESRGVVTSASYEARTYGIRAGMPMAKATRLCPAALVVPIPRTMIEQKHDEIAAVLAQWVPVVVAASVDEWYLDASGTETLYPEPFARTMRRMRTAVEASTGITLSIGCATNRFVAKMAADACAKPSKGGDGVFEVPPGTEAAFLATRDLGEIPGVGPTLQATLRRHGLVRVTDLRRVDRAALARWVGASTADWLRQACDGRDDTPVAPRGDAQSVSREETFPADEWETAALERELRRLAARVSADLRAQGFRARSITVKLRDADFRTRQAGRTLPAGIESDHAVYMVARELLAKLRADRWAAARLLGIRLAALEGTTGPEQLALFEASADTTGTAPVENARDRTLARAMDQLATKYGRDVLTRGWLPDSA